MDPTKASTPDIVTAKNVDLTSCDRELVQFPEAIQPHGAMLTVDEQTGAIMHASANCAAFVGKPPEAVIGADMAVLGPAWRDLLTTLHRMPLDGGPVNVARESFVGAQRGSNLFAHRSGGLIILELERAEPGPPGPASNLYAEVRADVARLQETKTLAGFFDLAVERIRAFTGYDRVMAYQFAEDGSGHVIAEAKGDDLEPYLGLHYPATDIPAPARRLFLLSWVRHLPDVDYVPVPLVAAKSPLITGPVDMSFASLRSVSVMYTGYLKNMGVKSTMVMPLVKEGKLWGLISAMHHAGPRHISYDARMAAEFLAHTLSLLMSAKDDSEDFGLITAMKATSDRLVEMLAGEADFAKALCADDTMRLLLTQVDAAGLAVLDRDSVHLMGKTPNAAEVRDLVRWIADQDARLYVSDALASAYPPGGLFAANASGVMAIEISADPLCRVLWFRPEQVETVSWAGDPHKPVDVGDAGGLLSLRPRNSFALWRESARNRSTAWRQIEKDAVLRLAQSIGGLVLERARKMQRISRELEASREELSGYADATSRELKEHLRGIHHLTTALHRRHAEAFGEESKQQIATILKLTQRMDGLIDALLEHAKLGSAELATAQVDLDAIVDAVLARYARQISEKRVEVRRSPLGSATCNAEWIGEIFSNLIANAIMYGDKAECWIEIGAEPTRPVRYYVRDNGIGIAEADQRMIFEMFHRVDDDELGAGRAGIGLTLTRKMVERHGGRIWVESRLGVGSTFFFTLEPDEHHAGTPRAKPAD